MLAKILKILIMTLYGPQGRTADDAEANCQTKGPSCHLVSIHSYEEEAFIWDLVGGTETIWIGLTLPGSFKFTSVQPGTKGSQCQHITWLIFFPRKMKEIEQTGMPGSPLDPPMVQLLLVLQKSR